MSEQKWECLTFPLCGNAPAQYEPSTVEMLSLLARLKDKNLWQKLRVEFRIAVLGEGIERVMVLQKQTEGTR